MVSHSIISQKYDESLQWLIRVGELHTKWGKNSKSNSQLFSLKMFDQRKIIQSPRGTCLYGLASLAKNRTNHSGLGHDVHIRITLEESYFILYYLAHTSTRNIRIIHVYFTHSKSQKINCTIIKRGLSMLVLWDIAKIWIKATQNYLVQPQWHQGTIIRTIGTILSMYFIKSVDG